LKLLQFNISLDASSNFIFYQRIMPLVLKELASSVPTNRRNVSFCAGEICKNGGAAAVKYVYYFARIAIFHV
jgi:hypothetical protein